MAPRGDEHVQRREPDRAIIQTPAVVRNAAPCRPMYIGEVNRQFCLEQGIGKERFVPALCLLLPPLPLAKIELVGDRGGAEPTK